MTDLLIHPSKDPAIIGQRVSKICVRKTTTVWPSSVFVYHHRFVEKLRGILSRSPTSLSVGISNNRKITSAKHVDLKHHDHICYDLGHTWHQGTKSYEPEIVIIRHSYSLSPHFQITKSSIRSPDLSSVDCQLQEFGKSSQKAIHTISAAYFLPLTYRLLSTIYWWP